MTKIHSHILGGAVVLSGLFASELAQAQDAPAAPAPAAPPPAAEAPPLAAPPMAEPAPAPAPPPMMAAEPPPLPNPAPIPETPPAVAPPADNPFKVTVGAGFRSGIRIQNPFKQNGSGNSKMNDQFLDELNVELRTSGKVTDIIGWTANFTVDGRTRAQASGGPIAFQAQALDLVGQLDFMDEFHVWVGRMLTPSDRSNFSGSWFMAPWNYAGILNAYYGPRGTEEVGRETGVTVWGDINKGKFKYYVGLMDLDSNFGVNKGGSGLAGFAGQNPLVTARVNYAFVGAEPGFYGSSTYYGGQDIVALGAAFQYQKDYRIANTAVPGTDLKDNLIEFNADFLAEKKFDFGTPGIEAAYYHMSGDTRSFNDFFYVLPTFTTGEILPAKGKLNALFRFQMAKTGEGSNKATHTIFEPSVAYLFKDYFAKLQLSYTYGRTKLDSGGDATGKYQFVQLGFQIQQ
jgi:hypothetical protein